MTSDILSRLDTCFRSVFPDLSETGTRKASMVSVASWDSLATVTLISVIEEEFEIAISDEDLQNFVSFELIAEVLGDLDEPT